MEAAYTSETWATLPTDIWFKHTKAEPTSILYYCLGKLILQLTLLIYNRMTLTFGISPIAYLLDIAFFEIIFLLNTPPFLPPCNLNCLFKHQNLSFNIKQMSVICLYLF
jgi:hypothetical protein